MACPHGKWTVFQNKIRSAAEFQTASQQKPLRTSPGLCRNLCECSWGGAEDDIISADKMMAGFLFSRHPVKWRRDGADSPDHSNLDPKLFHITTHPKSLVLPTCDLSCSILAFGLHGSELRGGGPWVSVDFQMWILATKGAETVLTGFMWLISWEETSV